MLSPISEDAGILCYLIYIYIIYIYTYIYIQYIYYVYHLEDSRYTRAVPTSKNANKNESSIYLGTVDCISVFQGRLWRYIQD